MAIIAMFYGIIVSMYFFDNRRHKLPHIHVKYQDDEVVLSIPEGEVLEGKIKPNERYQPRGKPRTLSSAASGGVLDPKGIN